MADNPGGGKPPPTTDELRRMVPDWNLAGDKNLLQLMESMHENMMQNMKSVNGKIDNLMSDLDTASISLQNVNNRFNGLSNTQFIENRVYDDDDEVMINSSKDEKNTDEIIPKVNKNNNKEESLLDAKEQELLATSKSLQVLESFYEEIQIVPDSDSESDFSEDEVQISDSIVLQPKNLYADQPLPHIIGSIQWKNKWHVGLVNEESESDSEDEAGIKNEEEDIELSSSESEDAYARQRRDDLRDKGLVEAQNTAKLGVHNDTEAQTSDDLGSDTDSENYLNHSRSVNSRNMETSKLAEKPAIGTKPLSTSTASDFAAELAKKLRGASVVDAPMTEDEESQRQSTSSSAKNGTTFKSMFSEKPAERIVGRVFSDEPPPLDSHDNPVNDDLFGANDTDDETDDLFADIHNPTNLFGPPRHQSSAYGGLFDDLGERGNVKSGANNKEDLFGNSTGSGDGEKGLFSSGASLKNDIGGERKGGGLFDDILDEEEDDLFGPKKVGEQIKKDLVGKTSDKLPTTKASSSLFDNDLEDEAAIFEPSAKPLTADSSTEQQNVTKKPIGGVSMLGNQNASIAAALRQRRKLSSSSESNESDTSLTLKKENHYDRPLPPKPSPKTIDTPVSNKTVEKVVTNKVIDQTVASKPTESIKSKNDIFSDENDIFGDDNLFFNNSKIETRTGMKNDNSNIKNDTKSHSLFDDLSDDENALFGQPAKNENPVQNNDSIDKTQVADVNKKNDLDKLPNQNSLLNEHDDSSLFAKCDSKSLNKTKDNEKEISKSIDDSSVNDNLNTDEQSEKSIISNVKSSPNEANIVLDSDKFKNIESEISNMPKINELLENDLSVHKTKISQTVPSQIEEDDIFAVNKPENSIFEKDQSNFDSIFGATKVTSNAKPETNDLEDALFGTANIVKTAIFHEEPPDFDHTVEDTKTTNVNDLFGEDDEDYYTAFKSSKSFLDDMPREMGTSSSGYNFLTDEPPDLDDEALFGNFSRGSEVTKVSSELSSKVVPQADEKDEFSSTENLFTSGNTSVSKNFDSIFKESNNAIGSPIIGKSNKLFGDLDSDSDDIFGIPNTSAVDTTQKTTSTSPETQNRLSETPDIVKPIVAKPNETKESQNIIESRAKTPELIKTPQKPDIINVKPKILNKPALINKKTETPKLDTIKSESEIDGANLSSRKPSEEPSPSKTVGKLKISNLNIDVNALKPGTSPKKSTPIERTGTDTASPQTVSKSPEKVNSENVSKPDSETKNSLPKSISFEAEPDTPELSNIISKERARIQVKRRPSSRKARKDALRKSALNLDITDGFSVPQDSEPDNFTYSLPNSPQSVLDESVKVIGPFEKQFHNIIGIKKDEQSAEDDSFESSMDEPKIISTLGSVYKNVGEKGGKSSKNNNELKGPFSDDEELFKKGCKSKEKKKDIVIQEVEQRSQSSKDKNFFDEKIDVTSKSNKEKYKADVLEEKINSNIETNVKDNITDGSKDLAKTNLDDSEDEDYLFKTKTSKLKKSKISAESNDPFDNSYSLFKPKSVSPFETNSEKVYQENADSDDDFLFNPKSKTDIVKTVITQNLEKTNSKRTSDNTKELNEEELFKPQPKMTMNQQVMETEKSLSEKSENVKPTAKLKAEINTQSQNEEAELFKPKPSSPSEETGKKKDEIKNAENIPKQENVVTKRNTELDDEEDLFGTKLKAVPKPLPNEDLFKTSQNKNFDSTKKQQNSVFQDSESDDDLFSGKKTNKNPPKMASTKEKLPPTSVVNSSSIFGDEEESFDDLFSGSKKSSAFSKGYEKTKPLFEETNDDDDIFGLSTSTSKSKSSRSSNSDAVVNTKKTVQSIPSSAEQVFQDPLSLFDED